MKKLIHYFLVLILFSSYSMAFIVGDWDFEDSSSDYFMNVNDSVIDKSGNDIAGTPYNRPILTTDTLYDAGSSVYFSGPYHGSSHIFIDHDNKMLLDAGKVSFFFKVDEFDFYKHRPIGLLSKDASETKDNGDLTFFLVESDYADLDYSKHSDLPPEDGNVYLGVRLQAANGSLSSALSYIVVPMMKIEKDVWYKIEFLFGIPDIGMQATLIQYSGQSIEQKTTASYPYYGGVSDVYGLNNDTNEIEDINGTRETMSLGARSWWDARGDSKTHAYFTGWMDNVQWETFEDLVLVHYFDSCDLSKNDTLLNYAENQQTGEASNSIIYGDSSQRTDDGFINKAIILQDKNSDYINLDINQINKKSIYDFSIVVWIKTEEDGSIITTNNNDISLSIKNNTMLAKIKGKEYTFETPNITDNQWHQIILTRKIMQATTDSDNYKNQAKINAYVDTTNLGRYITVQNELSSVIEPIDIQWMHLGEGFSGVIDEFSLLRNKISEYTVPTVYKNHIDHKNWDGTPRSSELECIIRNDTNITITDIQLPEGDSGSKAFNFTVSLQESTPHTQAITVDYAVSDGTATLSDSDYQSLIPSTLTFAVGETSKTVTVNVNGDTHIEPDETFNVTLSNATQANIIKSIGVGTILNDDEATLSIDNIKQNEGQSGTTDFTFTVTLDKVHTVEDVTFDYQTSDDTALISDNDYLAQNGSLTIPAGDLSTTITIKVNGDTKVEPDETFNVELSNITHTSNQTAKGIGTILNDDGTGLSIDDITQEEGDSGTTDFIFTVSLKNPSYQTIHVDYNTSDITAYAIDDNDYQTNSGTLTFNPGDLNQTITIKVNGDTKVEPDETFNVILSNADNNTPIDDDTGLGTILNDDNASLSINDVEHNEGAEGTTTPFSFTVLLDTSSATAVTVDYAVTDDTAKVSDTDYQQLANGTLTFEAGETSKTITVTVNGDDKVEPNETFNVTLSNANGASIQDELGIGTIRNDDEALIIINSHREEEGDSGTTDFIFKVNLTKISSETISVKYKTVDDSAKDDSDYQAINEGILTFNPGDTNTTITVKVNGDTEIEANEIFYVELYDAVGATIINEGKGEIVNDDYSNVSIDDVNKTEGDTGDITPFNFKVSLDQVDIEDVTIDYRIDDGTATKDDDDYNSTVTTGSITITAGQLSNSITVDVIGDDKLERDETFYVILTEVTENHSISDNNGTGTIINDDNVTITISDVNLTEGDFGVKSFDFNVTMSGPHYEEVRLNYYTVDGTATLDNSDYKEQNSTIVFEIGDTEKQIHIDVVGDLEIEEDETFYVRLEEPRSINTLLAKEDGLGTILNDDSGFNTNEITFNVERTDTSNQTINSDERNAWYTQVSGRTFAYDVVVYNKEMTALYPLSNVVIKIDLYAKDTQGNDTIIDTRYAYFDTEESRVTLQNVLIDDASRDALFAVITVTNGSSILYKHDCSLFASTQACYEDVMTYTPKSTDRTNARDNFAIRPAGYHYTLKAQGDDPLIDNATPNDTDIHLAAGEEYNLFVQALRYDENNSAIEGYTEIEVENKLTFNLGNACNDTQDRIESIQFTQGTAQSNDFDINETGEYTLSILDENWTKVDQNGRDCTKESNVISEGINDKQGCNIASEMTLNNIDYTDQKIAVNPHHFKVDLFGTSSPSDLNVIYMHTITKDNTLMSKQIDVNVTAKSKNDENLTNFVDGCSAALVSMDFNISSTPSLNIILDSQDEQRNLLLTVDKNEIQTITSQKTDDPTGISSDTFKKTQQGRAELKINYNINRSDTATLNPVDVNFTALSVTSTNTPYNVSISDEVVPRGSSEVIISNTFLYARVRATQTLYDEIGVAGTMHDTPLAIDVYCFAPLVPEECLNNDGDPAYGIRTSESSIGWWLATRYITTNQVASLSLINEEDIVKFDPSKNITIPEHPDMDDENNSINAISIDENNVSDIQTGCPPSNITADIKLTEDGTTSSWLIYSNSPLYRIKCSNGSEWAGAGKESHVLFGARVIGAGEEDAAAGRPDASGIKATHRMSW